MEYIARPVVNSTSLLKRNPSPWSGKWRSHNHKANNLCQESLVPNLTKQNNRFQVKHKPNYTACQNLVKDI